MTQNKTIAAASTLGRTFAWPRRVLLCSVSVLAICGAGLETGPFAPISQAHAQSSAANTEALTQELFLAIENQDLNGVKSAVRKGADVEARDYTGTQPVDLAISRGFFNIAHYLISVRNAKQAAMSGTPVQPAPSAEELAQSQTDGPSGSDELSELDALLSDEPASPPAPPAPAPSPVENVVEDPAAVTPAPQPIVDPFSTEQAAGELPVLGEIQEPEPVSNAPFSDDLIDMDQPPAALKAEEEPEQPTLPELELTQEPVEEQITPPAEDVAEQPLEEPAAPEEAVELSIAPDVVAPIEDVAPAPAAEVAKAVPKPEPDKPSAFIRFFTTFGDFFKPPNVTGVIQKERKVSNKDAVSTDQIAQELKQLDEERGNEVIKGPAVPMSPEELAKELPPLEGFDGLSTGELAALPPEGTGLPEYSVSSPSSLGSPLPPVEDAFSDLTFAEEEDKPAPTSTPATPSKSAAPKEDDSPFVSTKADVEFAPGVPGRPYDVNKPFGGGIDPFLLDYLGLSLRDAKELTGDEDETALRDALLVDAPITFDEAQDAVLEQDGTKEPSSAPVADDNNPFALLDSTEEPEVSDLLENLEGPSDIAKLDTPPANKPSADAGSSDNPFDLIEDDTPAAEGGIDELAGLLETNDKGGGWDVKEIENANIPDQIFVLSDLEPTGEVLDNVELTLGIDVGLGHELDEARLKLMEQDTIRRPCLEKGGGTTMFCTDKVNWPFELEEMFLVDTIMYQGTRAIARYEAGRSVNYHTLFRTDAFEQIVGYYTERYGKPTVKVERAIAPLAAPRQDNPTFIWKSREAGTDTIVNLEIRKFDDAQDAGFPDTNRGVILLYRNNAKPIFPVVSQLELMVLKTEGVETASSPSGDSEEGTPTEEVDPSSIWN